MEIFIRKARPEDAYDYAACSISTWQSAYKGIVPSEYLDNMPNEIEQRTENLRKSFADPNNIHSYCVTYDEKMIGYITIDIANANIWAIYLIKDFLCKVLGKKLLNFAVDELKRIEHKEICLWVFEENERARRFYEKNNFHYHGEKRVVDKYGGVPLTQLKYVLNL
jgi:GNAT superfamily N-acetyltransferase